MSFRGKLLGAIAIVIAGLILYSTAIYVATITQQVTPTQNQAISINLPYYAEVQYIDVINQTVSLSIPAGGTYTITAPLPPGPGYSLEYLEVYFPTPLPSIGISGNILKSVNEYGFVTSAYSPSGSIVLVNSGQNTVNGTVVVSSVFVKTIYVPLTNQASINITAPDYTYQYVTDQYVELTIPNNAPFSVQDVVLPNGSAFSQLVEKWSGNVTAIQLDYKHVKLDMSYLPSGNYSVELLQGSQYEMPFAMLVKGTQFYNTTVDAHSQVIITTNNFGIPSGWSIMGYVVTVYTVQPLVVGENGGTFIVEANRISPVYTLSQLIVVHGVSYILPPFIRFMPIIGIYVIYDTQFKVVNPLNVPLVVEYMPIIYKPVGQWSNGNLQVQVYQSDVAQGMWTSLVVQLPETATITSIVTPSGTTYSGYTSSELPWGSEFRLISISPDGHEAYIAVSTLGVSQPGLYTVNVHWDPLVVRVHNTYGSPVSTTITASQNGQVYGTFNTNSSGIALVSVSNPYPVSLSIYYEGVDTYNIGVTTLIKKPIDVTLGVYNVTAIVVGFFNQAISKANVTMYRIGTGPVYSQLTGPNGASQLNGVLAGVYQLTASYGHAKYSRFLTVNSDEVALIKTNILTIINGFPVTTGDAIIGAVGIPAVAGVAYAIKSLVERRKPYHVETT
ncbi:carboxypeptidase-like regulatory domain-containing protein [Caldivirga sp.]|uniref:carboxypeptidase-like regulatory domain-containing protein n=1 Tax=Caldivirga sp. TaxID=2080243 RepID=UPI0025B93AD1|nr:carboxypeptidase-like regulatory domain-containing protein [Caldivirga sp.]